MQRGIAPAESGEHFHQLPPLGGTLDGADRNRAGDAELCEALHGRHATGFHGTEGKERFEHAGGAHRVTKKPFVGRNGQRTEGGTREGLAFHLIVVGRGGAVGTDEGQTRDIGRQGGAKGAESALAGARGTRDVVGIIAHGAGNEAPIEDGTGRFDSPTGSVARKDEGGGGFSEIEAVARGIEGPTRGEGEGAEGLKTRGDEGTLLVDSAHHDVAIGFLAQKAGGEQERMGTGDAGIGDHDGNGGETGVPRDDGGRFAQGAGAGRETFGGSREPTHIGLRGGKQQQAIGGGNIEFCLRQRGPNGQQRELFEARKPFGVAVEGGIARLDGAFRPQRGAQRFGHSG